MAVICMSLHVLLGLRSELWVLGENGGKDGGRFGTSFLAKDCMYVDGGVQFECGRMLLLLCVMLGGVSFFWRQSEMSYQSLLIHSCIPVLFRLPKYLCYNLALIN